jgi:ribosome biogenesis GTPase
MSNQKVNKALKARVYRSTGSWYMIKNTAGEFLQARFKGKFKVDAAIKSSNPIAVGDWVSYEELSDEEGIVTITDIEKRNNYIVRVSPQNRHHKHIISANLDAAIVMATIDSPKTSMGFVDRFLITAAAYHIPAIIIINKIDLLKDKHQSTLATWIKTYTDAGYTVLPMHVNDNEKVNALNTLLANKTTLFSGHSGVGKSTLINKILPNIQQRTKIVSDWSGKGQHTTTFAEMFDLPVGGQIIDTPGVKEFGLIAIEKSELGHYYPEIKNYMTECKFNNCIHINEPQCAVKQAVQDGLINIDRYKSYLQIISSLE